MKSELSIKAENNEIDLETNNSDRALTVLKSLFSLIPSVGSIPGVIEVPSIGGILSEIFSTVIPNQKTDRIKLFVEVLDLKFSGMEKEYLRLKMKTEKFTDLLEDAIPMAARALTQERREYIANFLVKSISTEDAALLREKKLLNILNQLNDAEIIFLRYKAIQDHEKKGEFYNLHEKVLSPIPTHARSSRQEVEQSYLRKNYLETLESLGLTESNYKTPKKGETPEIDPKTGKLKSSSTSSTGLGRMLVKYIDDTYKDYLDEYEEEA